MVTGGRRPREETSTGLRADAIPGYCITKELHRGGQGVVYQAIQKSTKQKVALKVMLSGPLASRSDRHRFEREIELVGSLQHPNIAKIFDSGVADGHLYFAMHYVRGQRLTDYVRDKRLSLDDTLVLFKKVCGAVDHAHQRGVIHRDLKPSNIMVDDHGEPYVVDFGLAKIGGVGAMGTDVSLQVSLTGQIVGTPAYMSPEQAAGQVDQIDLRTDVYALGVLMYETVTGQMPYDVGGQITEVLKTIQDTEPIRLRSISRHINDEVETIAMKALSKDRHRRYATAGLLGEDIGRYLAGQPIEAKRDSMLYLARKMLRRYRAVAAVATVLMVVVMVALVISLGFWRRAVDDRRVAERKSKEALILKREADLARQQADAKADSLRRNLYAYNLNRAAAALEEDSSVIGALGAEQLLMDCPDDLRGWEWDWLQGWAASAGVRLLAGQAQPLFSADGRLLATSDQGSEAHSIKIWDATTWQVAHTLRGRVGTQQRIALDPAGTHVAAAHSDGTLVLWDIAAERELWSIAAHRDRPMDVEFSPDGHQIASVSQDGMLRLTHVKSGRELATIARVGESPGSVAFRPDGRNILVGARRKGQSATVWELPSCRRIIVLPKQSGATSSVAYSPDGLQIVTADGSQVIIYDADTGEESSRFTHEAGGTRYSVVFSPHSDLSEERRPGHANDVYSLAFSPDGAAIAAGSHEGGVRLRHVGTKDELSTIWLQAPVLGLSFRRSESQLAVELHKTGTIIWDMDADQQATSNSVALIGHQGPLRNVAFTHDSRQLVSASFDKTIKLWDVETGQELRTLRGHVDHVQSMACSPDGTRIVSADGRGELRIWDTETGRQIKRLQGTPSGFYWMAIAPDGTRFATGGRDGTLRVWEIDTGRTVFSIDSLLDAHVEGIAYAPDGSQIATVDVTDGILKFWDAGNGSNIAQWHEQVDRSGYPRCITFSPDGLLLASGGGSGVAKIWDAKTGERIRDIIGHGAWVSSVAFGNDATRLYTASHDRTTRVWSTHTGEELLRLGGHGSILWTVAVSPDGRKVASAGDDGKIIVWNSARVTADMRTARQTVAAATTAVNERFQVGALAADAIESLRADKTLPAEVLRVAVDIATARGVTASPRHKFSAP